MERDRIDRKDRNWFWRVGLWTKTVFAMAPKAECLARELLGDDVVRYSAFDGAYCVAGFRCGGEARDDAGLPFEGGVARLDWCSWISDYARREGGVGGEVSESSLAAFLRERRRGTDCRTAGSCARPFRRRARPRSRPSCSNVPAAGPRPPWPLRRPHESTLRQSALAEPPNESKSKRRERTRSEVPVLERFVPPSCYEKG